MKKLIISLFCLLPLVAFASDKARITSDHMKVDKDKGVMLLEGRVRGIMQQKGTKLHAERMELRKPPEGGEVSWGRAEGDLWVAEENKVALADYVTFDDSIQTSQMQGNVFVTNGELFLMGHKLDYQYELDKGRLVGKNRATEVIYHKKEADKNGQRLPVRAWAEEVLFNRQLSKVVMQGSVKVIDEGDGSEMFANRMTLFFNDQDELEQAVAEGNFILNQPKRKSKAARGHFDYLSELITLTGKATLQQVGEAAMRGEVIKMHMDEELGIVESGKNQPVRLDLDIK